MGVVIRGQNAAFFSQLEKAIRRGLWEPWEWRMGEERAPFTQGTKVMALAECRLGVGLGLGAKFLNDWLAGRSLSPLLGT